MTASSHHLACCSSEFLRKLASVRHSSLANVVVVPGPAEREVGQRRVEVEAKAAPVSAEAIVELIRNTPKLMTLQLSTVTIQDVTAQDSVTHACADRVQQGLSIFSRTELWCGRGRRLDKTAHARVRAAVQAQIDGACTWQPPKTERE